MQVKIESYSDDLKTTSYIVYQIAKRGYSFDADDGLKHELGNLEMQLDMEEEVVISVFEGMHKYNEEEDHDHYVISIKLTGMATIRTLYKLMSIIYEKGYDISNIVAIPVDQNLKSKFELSIEIPEVCFMKYLRDTELADTAPSKSVEELYEIVDTVSDEKFMVAQVCKYLGVFEHLEVLWKAYNAAKEGYIHHQDSVKLGISAEDRAVLENALRMTSYKTLKNQLIHIVARHMIEHPESHTEDKEVYDATGD